MLVLSRKLNEKILIGDEIEVTVIEVRGSRVRLGIRCRPEIPVHRSEIYEKIHHETTMAEVSFAACK